MGLTQYRPLWGRIFIDNVAMLLTMMESLGFFLAPKHKATILQEAGEIHPRQEKADIAQTGNCWVLMVLDCLQIWPENNEYQDFFCMRCNNPVISPLWPYKPMSIKLLN